MNTKQAHYPSSFSRPQNGICVSKGISETHQIEHFYKIRLHVCLAVNKANFLESLAVFLPIFSQVNLRLPELHNVLRREGEFRIDTSDPVPKVKTARIRADHQVGKIFAIWLFCPPLIIQHCLTY